MLQAETGKPGKQLLPQHKRTFSNKRVVCIEYMKLAEDDGCEIFRCAVSHSCVSIPHSVQIASMSTTRYGPRFRPKMKAEVPTPRQTPIHELWVQEFSIFNNRRDAAFRWIAQSLQTIFDPRPITKRTTVTTAQQTTWLKDTAPLAARNGRIQHSYKLFVDILSAYLECLKVSRGPATIAPIDLVMMIDLVF